MERSGILHKSYLRLKELFDNAQSLKQDQEHIIDRIKELCFEIIGKDIFKSEIRIVDGHDGSSFFWIMPVRVIDYSDTNNLDSVAEMASVEVSIEEDDVYRYLTPFLNQYFDDDLKANRMRVDSYWADDDVSYVSGFEWNLTHNFFTFDSMTNIIRDINDTIEALLSGKENAYSVELKEKTDVELIVDFYRRFVFRIKYMMQVGKENGYDLISFMGP